MSVYLFSYFILAFIWEFIKRFIDSDVHLRVDLVKGLRSRRKYSDAAHLCQHYLQDYCMAAQCFMEGLHFSEAWGLVLRYNLPDMKGNIRVYAF